MLLHQPSNGEAYSGGAWRASQPDSLALDVRGSDSRFDLAQVAVVVDFGTESVALAVPALREVGIVNDVVAGVEITVVIDPDDDRRWTDFSRRLDEGVVDLELAGKGLADPASGTVFDPFLGIGRSGPVADQSLDRLPAFMAFPGDYDTIFPNGGRWP